ncbi:MAG: hypothetical protein M3081_01500 [Gemmatimonadota bacterium]|nr:hypothetical protein [Gemmatimonadota bacterium]
MAPPSDGDSLLSGFDAWRAKRALKARAEAFVAVLAVEPPAADIEWLASNATSGDIDHATWELRYARRSLGMLTAQRDALDDRTASVVARALSRSLGHDPNIGPGKLRVVERQLNARLRAYRDALGNRDGAGSGWHLGRTLLRFAGRVDASPGDTVGHATEIISRYLTEANAALREHFGAAALPEDVAPSSIRGGGP